MAVIRNKGDSAIVETGAGSFTFDFLIFATGFEMDLSARPELAPIVNQIALWRDRSRLRRVKRTMYSRDILTWAPHSSSWSGRLEPLRTSADCTISRWAHYRSLGITGAAITGIKYGVPRLVGGLVRDLFREDAAAHYQDFLAYAVPELESLETEFEWIERMADEGLRSTHNLAKAVQRELASASKEKLASHPSERAAGSIPSPLAQEAPCYRGETASRQKLMSR